MMNLENSTTIFQQHGLSTPTSIHKIEVGFTNEVYDVDHAFIVKVCSDPGNEIMMKREVYLYDLISDMIPVPKVLIYDDSKTLYDRHYMIYPRIEGENLYNVWHSMNELERRSVIGQLCNYLKIINRQPYVEFADKFHIDIKKSWKDIVIDKMNTSLYTLRQKQILSEDTIVQIEAYVSLYQSALDQQLMGLVYWDAHFDNILVRDGQIVGLLDFERTDVSSIDFVLDIVKRMQEYPKKYMSEYAEQFARREDYEQLLSWFQEYYPELFQFDRLEERLSLYSIEHDLDTLIWYPEAQEVHDAIQNTINR